MGKKVELTRINCFCYIKKIWSMNPNRILLTRKCFSLEWHIIYPLPITRWFGDSICNKIYLKYEK
ncbi:MAG: hypothetical protein ACXAAI_13920, partial [Promethearchaeota archaeon]